MYQYFSYVLIRLLCYIELILRAWTVILLSFLALRCICVLYGIYISYMIYTTNIATILCLSSILTVSAIVIFDGKLIVKSCADSLACQTSNKIIQAPCYFANTYSVSGIKTWENNYTS